MYAPFSSIFDHTQRPKPQKMQWKYESAFVAPVPHVHPQVTTRSCHLPLATCNFPDHFPTDSS